MELAKRYCSTCHEVIEGNKLNLSDLNDRGYPEYTCPTCNSTCSLEGEVENTNADEAQKLFNELIDLKREYEKAYFLLLKNNKEYADDWGSNCTAEDDFEEIRICVK